MLYLLFKISHNLFIYLYSLTIKHSESFPSIHFQTMQRGQRCLFGPCHLLRWISSGQTREHRSHIYWWDSLPGYTGFTYLLYSEATWIEFSVMCFWLSCICSCVSIVLWVLVLSWSLCGGAHRLAVSEWEAPEAVSNCLQKFISVEPHPHNCGQVCVGPHFCVWQAQNTLLSDTQSWKYTMEEGPNCLEW